MAQSALWRTLEDLQPASAEILPPVAAQEGRRDFLKLAAAALALTAGGCRPPTEKIVPSVQGEDGPLEGMPRFFATAMSLGGSATGLLVESNGGRPTKVEGNP